YLKTYSIEFDENDELALSDEEKGKSDPYGDARKIDAFRKASPALKILLASLPKTTLVTRKNESGISVTLPEIQLSSIGGAMLIPVDQITVNLYNILHSATNLDDMLNRLREFSINNPNYQTLYKRLTKAGITDPINWDSFEEQDIQLISAFWKTFKKQNADVLTVFILPSGETVVSDSTLSSAAKQSKRDMFNSMVERIKHPSDENVKSGVVYFNYNKKTGEYSANTPLKKLSLSGSQLEGYTSFLNGLDIHFDIKDLKKLSSNQLKVFREATEGVLRSLRVIGEDKDTSPAVKVFTSKTLNIDKRLSQLGMIKAIIEHPEYESTYFNINGERTQTYIGTNLISSFYDVISKAKNIQSLRDSNFAYILTDAFAEGSVLMKRIFLPSVERIDNTEQILHPVFVDGIVDEEKGKRRESSKLSYKQRLIEEINLNLDGVYLNLVPGDASIEHAVRMHTEEDPFVSQEDMFNSSYIRIFRDYFISEVKLAREGRRVVGNNDSSDLRFFKEILGDVLHKTIMSKTNKKLSPEELYNTYKGQIDNAVKQFIAKEGEETYSLLREFDIIKMTEDGLAVEGIKFGDDLTEDKIKNKTKLLAINYIIANIEYHKLFYSDPYQYKDELKRIKNFNSPGEPLLTASSNVLQTLHKVYNKAFKKGEIGWTNMNRNSLRSVTFADIFSYNDLDGYDRAFEETDGGGWITMQGNRFFRILAGSWTEGNEIQYKYDIAYEKKIKKFPLTKEELLIDGGNPGIRDTYTPLKPIVRGNKNNGRT
ncbi:MAG TPA: hypothetical protein PLR64_03350, partial [Candidatus Dojkabacteria bacterium]|nr:hypothetical protein [Candidatus Dojkabacteria bacterium]